MTVDLITGADTETSREVVESLTSYPAGQLASLTARLDSFRDSENFSIYLDMLDNMAESEARWAANMMEVKEAVGPLAGETGRSHWALETREG